MQKSIKDTEIIPALSSDHSLILYSSVSKGFHSLLINEEFVTKMRNYIHLKVNKMNHENINAAKFDGYLLENFQEIFSKTLATERREKLRILENILKLCEKKIKMF